MLLQGRKYTCNYALITFYTKCRTRHARFPFGATGVKHSGTPPGKFGEPHPLPQSKNCEWMPGNLDCALHNTRGHSPLNRLGCPGSPAEGRPIYSETFEPRACTISKHPRHIHCPSKFTNQTITLYYDNNFPYFAQISCLAPSVVL